MTMNTIKTLMLAGAAALSLGVGAAMAQEGGISVPAIQVTTPAPAIVQSGSSDVETVAPLSPSSPYNVTTHPQFDFSGAGGPG
jgi:hypothetical protein